MSVLKFSYRHLNDPEAKQDEIEKESGMERAVSLTPVNKHFRCVIFHNDKLQEFCCISRHDRISRVFNPPTYPLQMSALSIHYIQSWKMS
jgi:hypothetical protein